MDKKELKFISKKHYEKNVGRPAGTWYEKNGILMRPAQDCSKKYGEKIIVYQVDDLNANGVFLEHEVETLNVISINTAKKFERIHQITSDRVYKVVDVFKEKIDLLHIPKILIRSRKK